MTREQADQIFADFRQQMQPIERELYAEGRKLLQGLGRLQSFLDEQQPLTQREVGQ